MFKKLKIKKLTSIFYKKNYMRFIKYKINKKATLNTILLVRIIVGFFLIE